MAEGSDCPTRGNLSSSGSQHGMAQGPVHAGVMVSTSYASTAPGNETALAVNAFGCDGGGKDSGANAASQVLAETEEEVDLYTWCEECGMNTIGDCFIHGKVITITDNKLPSRARLSLPSILSLKKVNDEGGDLEKEGVFAKRLIKPRTQFGPLEAPPLQDGMTLPPDVFDVRVLQPGRQKRLDLTQEEACNWMMFVRPAQTSQESNLAAYQLQDHIYYISTKVIHQLTELKVWYLHGYGQQFGKQPLPAALPPMQVFPDNSGEIDLPSASEDQEPSMVVVGTRVSAAPSSGKLVCELCNTVFRSLTQSVAHNCHALDESQASPRPARRKGRPRKVSGSSNRGRPVTRASTSSTTLPSVNTLIKTEMKTEVAVPDSTVSDLQQEPVAKKRGRPKGSKNKPLAEGEIRPPRKPPMNMKRKRPRLDCSHCPKSFYSVEQHRVHEAEHTGQKPYICQYPDCGKGFGSKFKYWRHSLVHEQPQNRQCPYCDRCFNRVDHLKNHVLTHDSNRQQWSCEKCGKHYLYRSTFLYHMAHHQAQDGPDLICTLCHTEFSTREALIEHVHTHNRYKPDLTRSKNHQCPKCQKKFTTSKDVRRHMVTHTKDRSFLCEFCPQTFARKDHLRRHYKSNHKKEVLEQAALTNAVSPCLICLKPFKSEKHLQYHVSTAHRNSEEAANIVKPEKVAKRHSIMQVLDPQNSKVVVMQGAKITMSDAGQVQQHQQQAQQQQHMQQQQQHLSLLPQSTAQVGNIHPVQIHVSDHHQQQEDHHHQQQQQQQQQNLLQAGTFITNLQAGSGGQAVEVVADGNNHFNQQMLTLKTIPYRFPSGQVLASVHTSQNSAPTVATVSSLRQILNFSQPQQQTHTQQQQQQEAQQQLSQQMTQPQQTYTHSEVQSTPTMVSMLSSSRGDGFLDLAGKGQAVFAQDASSHLKPLSAQWVLAGNTQTLPDSSGVPGGSDTGDHCYATGVTTTAGDVGLKLSLPALSGKVINSVTQMPDIDTLRLLQSCQAGGLGLGTGMGGTTQSVPAQSTTAGSSSSLQASWDTLSDLVTIPLSDIITPLSGSQASVINLPVTVNVPISDGPINVTAAVTLSQPS